MCRPPRDTARPTSQDRGRSGEEPSQFPARPAREATSRGLGELRPPPSTRAWTPARGQPPGRRLPGARCSCRLLGRCGPRTPVRPLFPGGREHLTQTFSPFSAHISGPALWPPFKRLPLRPLKSTGRRSQQLGSRAPRRGRPAGSGFPLPNAVIAAANLRASPPSLVSPSILLAPPPLRLTARVAWTPPPATPGPTVILAHAGGRGSRTARESPGSPGSPGQLTHLAPCHARPMPGETQLAFALHLRPRRPRFASGHSRLGTGCSSLPQWGARPLSCS